MVTYNNVVNAFKEITIAHKQLGENHFYHGEPTDFQAVKDLKMPAILLQPMPTTNEIMIQQYKFRLFYIDIIEADLTTLQDVYSDSLQVLNDIVNELEYNPDIGEYILNMSSTYTPFQEKFDDLTAGNYVEITINTPRNTNRCNTPMNSYTATKTNND